MPGFYVVIPWMKWCNQLPSPFGRFSKFPPTIRLQIKGKILKTKSECTDSELFMKIGLCRIVIYFWSIISNNENEQQERNVNFCSQCTRRYNSKKSCKIAKEFMRILSKRYKWIDSSWKFLKLLILKTQQNTFFFCVEHGYNETFIFVCCRNVQFALHRFFFQKSFVYVFLFQF